jgi:hypothetical protein
MQPNAPAKLRRACSASHSATDLPRAGSFSRQLESELSAGPPQPRSPFLFKDADTTRTQQLQALTSRGMLTATSRPSQPRRRAPFHRQPGDTYLAGPLVGPFEDGTVNNGASSRRAPRQPRSRCYHLRRRSPDQHTPFEKHWPTGRKSGSAARRTKPRDAAPQVRHQVTTTPAMKPSATSRSSALLASESANLSNAPAKLRRACSASHSTTGLPRAASFSRLFGAAVRCFTAVLGS